MAWRLDDTIVRYSPRTCTAHIVDDGDIIASVYGTTSEEAAERARLIAAAREMLEALEGVQESVCSFSCPSVKKIGEEWTHSPKCLAISAALAKARGEEGS